MPRPRFDESSAERQTLDEIREWHGDIVSALLEQRASALHAIHHESSRASKFLGLTEREIEEYFDSRRQELDWLTILNLIASAEATIRMDFLRRIKGKPREELARWYQSWHKTLKGKKKRRPDFDEEGILKYLKKSKVMPARIIGGFRECLPARHWVGHGRYWTRPSAIDRFTPDDVYARADAILRALPD